MTKPVIYKKPRLNAISLSNLLLALQEGNYTMMQLCDMTGLAIQSVRHYCNTFHRKGVIHICDWEEDARGGRTLKVFKLGPGTDMAKPKPKSSSQSSKQWRAKQNQVKMLHATTASMLDTLCIPQLIQSMSPR